MLPKPDLHQPSLLFFGGPYGNFQALTALRSIAEGLGLSPSSIVCTGDTVAYCAQPSETVETIREWGIHVIAGNVEIQLANDAGDCGCNFIKGSVCDQLSERWFAFASDQITSEQRAWMRSLPTTLTLQIGGRKLGVVHGSHANISEFLFRSSAWEKKSPNFASLECDIIVGGHCGIPFIEQNQDKLWVNAGVIGMPANDGACRGWYLLIHENEDDLLFSLRSFGYDYEQAARLMDELGLPCEYASTLRTGLWCSLDNLPIEERTFQGAPLSFLPAIFPKLRSANNSSSKGERLAR
jgi:predicted phosphodiesterase